MKSGIYLHFIFRRHRRHHRHQNQFAVMEHAMEQRALRLVLRIVHHRHRHLFAATRNVKEVKIITTCESDCDPPPPPEISLKYIGFLTDHEGPVAFLTDGKEVFMGRVDDIIANRYLVVKITEEGVELGYVNLKTKQSKTIPFSGSKS